MFRVLVLLCLGLGSALAVGCATPVAYQPPPDLADPGDDETLQRRLRDTLLRVVNPPIDQATVTPDFFTYHLNLTTLESRITFENIHRVDVYEHKLVFVRGHGEQILAQFWFASLDDAKQFADLVMALRQRYLQRKAVKAPSTPDTRWSEDHSPTSQRWVLLSNDMGQAADKV
jgi:hypothetical protein